MELTRRDALAALAAGGVAVGATVVGDGSKDAGARTASANGGSGGVGDHERETLIAVARVVYPSAVTGIDGFVGTYLDGRAGSAYASGAAEAVGQLDDMGEEWHGGRFVDLDGATRERLLREVGADTAEPDPEGSPAERIRYYLVNELLFALYTSPTGGELVGIENPQGHPGGLASYQRGPRG